MAAISVRKLHLGLDADVYWEISIPSWNPKGNSNL